MKQYTQGDLIEFEILFVDTDTRRAIDPDVVVFAYRVGTNSATAPITYVSSSTPAVGTIWRVGVGRYKTWVSSITFAGVTYPEWTSTGVGQAASAANPVMVNPRNF